MLKIIVFILTFILSGCASFSQPATIQPIKPTNHYLPWANRKLQLNALQDWQADGTIAIYSKQAKGVNASFSWQQMKDNYQLRLFGPLGTHSILLTGKPQQVTLINQNEKKSAQSAESLLKQQLGFYLPVSQLYYWLRGLPTPQFRYTMNLDAYNRLLELRQSHWLINYLHYTNIGTIDIPDRIILSNAQWKVKILITHWDLR